VGEWPEILPAVAKCRCCHAVARHILLQDAPEVIYACEFCGRKVTMNTDTDERKTLDDVLDKAHDKERKTGQWTK
jgi:hypothetical protein